MHEPCTAREFVSPTEGVGLVCVERFTEIEVPSVQLLEGRIEGLLYLTMVCVGKFGGDEYLFTGDAGRLDPNADPGLVLVFVSGVNVTVS